MSKYKRGGVKKIHGKKKEEIIQLMGYRWDHNANDYELGQIIEFVPDSQLDIERVKVVLSNLEQHLDEYGNPGKYFDTIDVNEWNNLTNQYIEMESEEEEDGYKTPTESEEVNSMEGPSKKKQRKTGGLRKTKRTKKTKKTKKTRKTRRKRRNTRKKRS